MLLWLLATNPRVNMLSANCVLLRMQLACCCAAVVDRARTGGCARQSVCGVQIFGTHVHARHLHASVAVLLQVAGHDATLQHVHI
jgi:hypothetical protein